MNFSHMLFAMIVSITLVHLTLISITLILFSVTHCGSEFDICLTTCHMFIIVSVMPAHVVQDVAVMKQQDIKIIIVVI